VNKMVSARTVSALVGFLRKKTWQQEQAFPLSQNTLLRSE